MSALTLLWALVIGAVVEVMLPPWTFGGHATVPLVLSVVLYYALYYPISYLMTAAILGGLLLDSSGLVPLGYSAFCFCIVALIASRFRDVIFLHEFWSHVCIGGLGSSLAALLLALLLKGAGLLLVRPVWVLARLLGSALLGMVCVPVIMALMTTVDRTLGNRRMGVGSLC